MAMLQERFGKLVAAHRVQAGLTQTELAEASGLAQAMIAQIEGGKTGTSFSSIERIAEALKIDPADLFVINPVNTLPTRTHLTNIDARIALLSDRELLWLDGVIKAALSPRS